MSWKTTGRLIEIFTSEDCPSGLAGVAAPPPSKAGAPSAGVQITAGIRTGPGRHIRPGRPVDLHPRPWSLASRGDVGWAKTSSSSRDVLPALPKVVTTERGRSSAHPRWRRAARHPTVDVNAQPAREVGSAFSQQQCSGVRAAWFGQVEQQSQRDPVVQEPKVAPLGMDQTATRRPSRRSWALAVRACGRPGHLKRPAGPYG